MVAALFSTWQVRPRGRLRDYRASAPVDTGRRSQSEGMPQRSGVKRLVLNCSLSRPAFHIPIFVLVEFHSIEEYRLFLLGKITTGVFVCWSSLLTM